VARLGAGHPHPVLELFLFLAAAEVSALFPQLHHHPVENALLDQQGVVGAAGGGVVEGFADPDLLGRIGQIGILGHDDDGIAGPDAVGRLAAGIGGLDHHGAAGREHQIHLAHELLAQRNRGFLDILDQVDRGADPAQPLPHEPADHRAGSFGRRMRGEDDRVAALEDSRPVAGRRGRGIRHGGERPDDPYRLGVFCETPGLVPLDHPHRFGMLDVPADAQNLDLVLGQLVFVNAHAGFFHGDFGAGGDIVVPVNLPGHRKGHFVDLLLGVILHLFLGSAGLGYQRTDDFFVACHIPLLIFNRNREATGKWSVQKTARGVNQFSDENISSSVAEEHPFFIS